MVRIFLLTRKKYPDSTYSEGFHQINIKRDLNPLIFETFFFNCNPHIEVSIYTPGTAGGPGGNDRTLAVKSRKNVRKITFFSLKNKI